MLKTLDEEIKRILLRIVKRNGWRGYMDLFDEDEEFGDLYLDDVHVNLRRGTQGDGSARMYLFWTVDLPNHRFQGEYDEEELKS